MGNEAKGKNVVSNDDSFCVLNSLGNSSGRSPNVVKDGMDSGPGTTLFVDPKVVEGVDEPVNFRSLDSDKPINATTEVKIPKASILDVHSRFGFSLYGYFVGKRVAFPVVENYVNNAWKKFGLVRVMMNSNGLFFFKFASIEGMNGVLENGPWFIRFAPIILKKWTPNANLLKEDLKSVHIWVKYIPIVVFTADGWSVMATKLGNPIMLDSYTSSMCLQSCGRMDYARALIDFRADREFKEDMVIVTPNVEDGGEVIHTVRVVYEWEPPRCGVCMVFGHDDMLCPKRPVKRPKKQHTNHDGFQHPSSSDGTNVGSKFQVKPKKPIWQVVSKKNSDSLSGTKKNSEVSRKMMSSTNPFDALNTIEEGDELGSKGGGGRRIQVRKLSKMWLVRHLVVQIIHLWLQGLMIWKVIERKLVLLDDEGKPLKPSKSTLPSSSNVVSKKVDDLANEDNDSEVEDVYDETATYMASKSFNVNKASKSGSGGGNKSLYEQ
ncbi:zinc knuckle CX2CX4HX4C containing protein [Tanacetum coccineum]